MIKHFYVQNFELVLSSKPSLLLIGKNGSGKSTVSFALEVLQKAARGINRVGQLIKPSDFTRGASDKPIRFEIEAILEDKVYRYSLALEYPSDFRELRVLEESLYVEGKAIYTRDKAQVQFARQGKEKETEFRVDWHIVALPVMQEKSTEDPIYVFKTWLSRMLILAPIPSLITGVCGSRSKCVACVAS